MTEIAWAKVVGFEGIYEISTRGQVKRVAGGPGAKAGRILRSARNSSGYRSVSLLGRHSRLIHRLVVEAFIGPIPKGRQVNHKNGRKDDNRVENLERVTPLENVRHAHEILCIRLGRERQKFCNKGHLLADTRVVSRNRSRCVVCHRRYRREWMRAWRARRKENSGAIYK